MWNVANPDLIDSIWKSVNDTATHVQPTTIRQLTKKFLAEEWADIEDVRDLMWAMDGRFQDSKLSEIATAFHIPMHSLYPRHGSNKSWLLEPAHCWSQT